MYTTRDNYNSDIFDVAVIGGGPAGAAASYFLAGQNKKVILLEKKTLPRYKTCGGGIVYRVNTILPLEINKIAERLCHVAEIYDHRAKLKFITRRNTPIITMVMRDSFDNYLLEEAKRNGATVLENFFVAELQEYSSYVEVLSDKKDSIKAKYIVAADGAGGVISRKIYSPNDVVRMPALECEVHVDEETFAKYKDTARFDFDILPNGYGWIFPKQDHLSVGIIRMKSSSKVNLNEMLDMYFEFLGLNKITKNERHGFLIPMNKKNRVFAKGRIILAGDAAAIADPVTGEGISNAILSGKFAAEAILYGGNDPNTVAGIYNKKIRDGIVRQHNYAKIIYLFVFYFPAVRVLLFREYGQKLSELMTDIITGKKTYSDLLTNPLNYFKLIKYFLLNRRHN